MAADQEPDDIAPDQVQASTLASLRRASLSEGQAYYFMMDADSIVQMSDDRRDSLINAFAANPRLALVFGSDKGWLLARTSHVRSAFTRKYDITNASQLADELRDQGFEVAYTAEPPFRRATFRKLRDR